VSKPMFYISQEDQVMNWLRTHDGISSNDAITHLGVTRLSAIIWKLRHKRGFTILARTRTGKNRWGLPCSWTEYYLP